MKTENNQTRKPRSQINYKKIATQAAITFAQGALFAAGSLLINRMSSPGSSMGGDLASTDANILPLKKHANS